ncbi:hypothetical protein GH714_036643 [Hevea brasiliensis]|uniref:Uncharacterized protein n=1 Tax=Hevea brasiliensis TaxID=3981 RepID=A0A6A6NF04_HEVBR|nr:hypothetical protein GH714_036643 [Hevea brasiliensis]
MKILQKRVSGESKLSICGVSLSVYSDIQGMRVSTTSPATSFLAFQGIITCRSWRILRCIGVILDVSAQLTAKATILKKLKRYGISGILSYGLLNTAYYLTTFLLVWFYVAPSPAKMGYFAAVERFLKVMAMVWAGSQVTKLVRAGGALALAPFVDRGLSWFTVKFKFESEGKAFMALVGVCFGLAFILFLVVTLLWA